MHWSTRVCVSVVHVRHITHITQAQHLHTFGNWQPLHLSNRSCLTYQWEAPLEVFTHHGPSSMAVFCNIKALQPSDDALEMNNKTCATASECLLADGECQTHLVSEMPRAKKRSILQSTYHNAV